MKVFNLTDVETSALKMQGLVAVAIRVGTITIEPGGFADVPNRLLPQINRHLSCRALSIDEVPAYYRQTKARARVKAAPVSELPKLILPPPGGEPVATEPALLAVPEPLPEPTPESVPEPLLTPLLEPEEVTPFATFDTEIPAVDPDFFTTEMESEPEPEIESELYPETETNTASGKKKRRRGKRS